MEELPTIQLPTQKRVYVFVGCYALFMAILCVTLLIFLPTLEFDFLKYLISLFALASLVLFVSVLKGQPRLTLTPQGFEVQAFFFVRRVRWLDIAEIKEDSYYENGWNKDRFLELNYVKGREPKGSWFNRKRFGYDDWLSNWSTLKSDEFRDLVISYWGHAKQAQALELSKQVLNPRLKTD
jgi:hypothetical protein